jgi:hypothetical protein
MGLDLILQKSGGHLYTRSYGAFHTMKDIIHDFYKVDKDIIFFFFNRRPSNKYGGYPVHTVNDMRKLYPDNKKTKEYIEYLQSLERAGILALAPLLLHSDCDGYIPWKLCGPMIPLLENILNSIRFINGEKVYFSMRKNGEISNGQYELGVMANMLDALKASYESKDNIIFT